MAQRSARMGAASQRKGVKSIELSIEVNVVAYDEALAERLRSVLNSREGVTERKMFGGLCFMLGGNMAFGVTGDDLMVRVGPDKFEEILSLPHARPMDFTGRPMKGMVYVAAEALQSDEGLSEWAERGMNFAGSLPPK